MTKPWGFECPRCKGWVSGWEEAYNEKAKCPHCKTELIINAEPKWEIEVTIEEDISCLSCRYAYIPDEGSPCNECDPWNGRVKYQPSKPLKTSHSDTTIGGK